MGDARREPLIWNDRELNAWPEIKAGLIARLANATSTRRFAIYQDDDYLTGANLPLTGEAEATQKRGYIMYRESAAFIAARPAPSGLTRGDRDGNEARG